MDHVFSKQSFLPLQVGHKEGTDSKVTDGFLLWMKAGGDAAS